MIFEVELRTSKPAKLKCNILFLKKNDKYILDVHCSVRIRIFDEMTLNRKPLFKIFLGEAFAPIPVSNVPFARHTALAGTLLPNVTLFSCERKYVLPYDNKISESLKKVEKIGLGSV